MEGPDRNAGDIVRLEVAADVRAAHARGDHRRVASLLQASPIEAWFSLMPHELRAVLAALPPLQRRASPQLTILGLMLEAPGHEAGRNPGRDQVERMRRGVNHIRLRMRGAPRTALRHFPGVSAAVRTVSALFDTTGGLEAVVSVQTGITQMLAGDLTGALANFTRAQLNPHRGLPFLARDAHVKGALIHAQFGDARLARIQLDAAARVARTDSWAELVIDTHAELAEILLLPAGSPEAVTRLESVPLGSVGELWPYHILALQAVYARADRRADGASRIETMRAAAPPAEAGEGLPGSVFGVVLAEDAALRGDPAAARVLLAQADPALAGTALATALVDHVAGEYERAVQGLVEVQGATEGLRRTDIRRLALLAASLQGAGELDACVETLEQLHRRYGALSSNERLSLPTVLWPLIGERFGGWLTFSQAAARIELPTADSILTAREREVLGCLAAGQTRDQVAATLFISVNTVKTHQRSLYRKLDATSRAEALVEAARRGLV
ncbi:MAG: helix-turn-helix transcriptional regulator [Propionicimonas sp.]|nr:helix-turn-helix transcriptional regulator [Propionicimonas sp.]